MAIKDIVDQIDKEARAEADKVIAEARERCQAIQEKAARRIDSARERGEKTAAAAADAEKARILTMARLDLRKALLSERQTCIEGAFSEARQALVSAPDDARASFLVGLIEAATVTGTEEVVLAPRDREAFPKKKLEEINKRLSKKGLEGKLVLAEEARPIGGGCILVASDYEVNCSIDALLRTARERLEKQVSDLLFGSAA